MIVFSPGLLLARSPTEYRRKGRRWKEDAYLQDGCDLHVHLQLDMGMVLLSAGSQVLGKSNFLQDQKQRLRNTCCNILSMRVKQAYKYACTSVGWQDTDW
jgi:hypothetical protein